MTETDKVQLSMLIDHSSPDEILHEVREIFQFSYRLASFAQVEKAFKNIVHLFRGEFPGYLACNTEYHNLTHTLDCFLATARLIDGKNSCENSFSEELAVNMLLAALFHDTGYIQETDDSSGTGAKYTQSHVERSVTFIEKNSVLFSLTYEQAEIVAQLVSCTGLKAEWVVMNFKDVDEARAGAVLGSADLLGQMSDRAYLEKLLFLYYEFREAGMEGFNTEFDILRKTLDFYEMTRTKLDETLMKVYLYAEHHFQKRFNIPRNLYMAAIENQIEYLKGIICDESSNFRQKLKRIDLERIESRILSSDSSRQV